MINTAPWVARCDELTGIVRMRLEERASRRQPLAQRRPERVAHELQRSIGNRAARQLAQNRSQGSAFRHENLESLRSGRIQGHAFNKDDRSQVLVDRNDLSDRARAAPAALTPNHPLKKGKGKGEKGKKRSGYEDGVQNPTVYKDDVQELLTLANDVRSAVPNRELLASAVKAAGTLGNGPALVEDLVNTLVAKVARIEMLLGQLIHGKGSWELGQQKLPNGDRIWANRGPMVDTYRAAAAVKPGGAWCTSFAGYVLQQASGGLVAESSNFKSGQSVREAGGSSGALKTVVTRSQFVSDSPEENFKRIPVGATLVRSKRTTAYANSRREKLVGPRNSFMIVKEEKATDNTGKVIMDKAGKPKKKTVKTWNEKWGKSHTVVVTGKSTSGTVLYTTEGNSKERVAGRQLDLSDQKQRKLPIVAVAVSGDGLIKAAGGPDSAQPAADSAASFDQAKKILITDMDELISALQRP